MRETADVDLAKMGLRVISYTLKDVSDANGYMNSLGVRRIEEVKKEARMVNTTACKRLFSLGCVPYTDAPLCSNR